MGDIKDEITVVGLKSKKPVQALFDTGADIGRITKKLADELGMMQIHPGRTFSLGNGRKIKAAIVGGFVNIKGCQFPAFFAISKKETPPVTIGLSTMQSMGIELDPQKETYSVRCNIPKL